MTTDVIPGVVPASPPVPIPDRDTQPFWDGCAQRHLRIPRCDHCGRYLWQPAPLCPVCRGDDVTWQTVAGDGAVASWMVARPPVLPYYADKVPYAIVLAALDIGVRMVGYLVDDGGQLVVGDERLAEVSMGARLALRWHDQDGLDLPSWTLV